MAPTGPESSARRRPLRVAHVTATFPPYAGGTGNVAWHSARELARLGHEVHVLTARTDPTAAGDGVPERTAPPGVRVHRLRPLLRVGNAPLLPGLLPALRGFDLIHLHYPFYFGAELTWLAARAFRTPLVVTYHQDVELQGALRAVPTWHHRLVGRRVLGSARRILFTTRDYARSSYAADLLARPTSLELPNGVDVDRFTPSPPGARREYGYGDRDVVALFVGALDRAHYFKGLDVLLDALRLTPQVRLLVVGSGGLLPEYRRRAAAAGVADRTTFAGRVPDERLPAVYAAADMVVLPSVTRGEAFGVVLLEAMACGKPVVASDLPGVRAVVGDTGGGILSRAGDAADLARAMGSLASDPERRAAFGRAGRLAVETRYTWPALVRRLDAIYCQLVTDPQSRQRPHPLLADS